MSPEGPAGPVRPGLPIGPIFPLGPTDFNKKDKYCVYVMQYTLNYEAISQRFV